jgi:hypothetical protein
METSGQSLDVTALPQSQGGVTGGRFFAARVRLQLPNILLLAGRFELDAVDAEVSDWLSVDGPRWRVL